MDQKKKALLALLSVPGTLFWVLVVAGAVTKNNTMIGVAVAMGALVFITAITIAVRGSNQKRAENRRLWNDGTPATARVIAISSRGGGINDHPEVDFELEVTLPDQPPYRTQLRALVGQLAIPRIQPECTIAVRVDPRDRHKLVLDAALTPYGYR